jgi:gas vesicle protein
MTMDENEEETQGMPEGSDSDAPMSEPAAEGGGNPLMMGIVVGVIIGVIIGAVVGMLMAPEDTSDKVDDLEEDIKALQEDMDALQVDLDTAETELNNTQTALGLAEAQIVTIQDELTTTLDELQISNDALNQSIMDFANATAALDEVMSQLTRSEEVAVLAQPHEIHLSSRFLDFGCGNCHDTDPEGEVVLHGKDLYFVGELGSTDFRTDVNIEESCVECHSVFSTKDMQPSYEDDDCTTDNCHPDVEDDHSSDYVVVAEITKDDCLLCHGGNAWYQSTED